MSGSLPGRRAFEHALRDLPEAGSQGGDSPPSKSLGYQRLMQVVIHHTYYNRSGFACPDFSVRPTASTAALMRDLGLLFKDEGTGFSVFYNTAREDLLVGYLRQQGESWTRLSFILPLRNPYFVNFTAIPLDTNPAEKNFYFTNRNAWSPCGEALLNPGCCSGWELLKVAPSQLPVEVPPTVTQVVVRDVSGKVVLEAPRCVGEGESRICVDKLYLDFSRLPEGRYTVCDVPSSKEREPVLYTALYPMPLCLVDLLLTDPKEETSGIYPVRGLWDPKPIVQSVRYTLRFESRATTWIYYIVPSRFPAARKPAYIQDLSDELGNPVEFHGPCEELLPNGVPAFRFTSQEELPLAKWPFHRFRLWGQEETSRPVSFVMMDTLPTTSGRQVIPPRRKRPCGSVGESSEIHVYI